MDTPNQSSKRRIELTCMLEKWPNPTQTRSYFQNYIVVVDLLQLAYFGVVAALIG